MMSEHPELPDLIRKTGVPVPQVLDRSGETLAWKPAEDMAPKLNDLLAALGAPEDAKQADPVQEATAIALLKGLLELTAMRATDQTLTQIKTALTDGTQQVQLTGSLMESYGPTVNERPVVSDVPVGAVYMAVQTQEFWQSDGTQWVVM